MNTAPISASQTSARIAVRLRPPALFSERAEPDRRPKVDGAGNVGTRLLAHQVGKAARHLALVGLGKGAEQHVGDDQTQHVVAEEFQALVGAGAVARAGERGDVGQRLLQHRRVPEAVSDALLEGGRATAAAFLFLGLRPLLGLSRGESPAAARSISFAPSVGSAGAGTGMVLAFGPRLIGQS